MTTLPLISTQGPTVPLTAAGNNGYQSGLSLPATKPDIYFGAKEKPVKMPRGIRHQVSEGCFSAPDVYVILPKLFGGSRDLTGHTFPPDATVEVAAGAKVTGCLQAPASLIVNPDAEVQDIQADGTVELRRNARVDTLTMNGGEATLCLDPEAHISRLNFTQPNGVIVVPGERADLDPSVLEQILKGSEHRPRVMTLAEWDALF